MQCGQSLIYLFGHRHLLFSDAVDCRSKNVAVVEDLCDSVGMLHHSTNLTKTNRDVLHSNAHIVADAFVLYK